MQQKGRGIRTADGKTDCIFLDHAGNCLNHGLPVHFEVPDLRSGDHRSSGKAKKERKMVACSECGFALEPDQYTCPGCGVDRPKPAPKVRYLDGDLVKYGELSEGTREWGFREKRNWYQQCIWEAQERGKKVGSVYYLYQAKFKEKPPWRWRELPGVPAQPATLRFIKSQRIRYAKSQNRRQSL